MFLMAAQNGHAGVTKILLQSGADVNKARHGGFAPLFMAVQGQTEAVKVLLRHGVDVNKALDDGQTPLTKATDKSHLAIVKVEGIPRTGCYRHLIGDRSEGLPQGAYIP